MTVNNKVMHQLKKVDENSEIMYMESGIIADRKKINEDDIKDYYNKLFKN